MDAAAVTPYPHHRRPPPPLLEAQFEKVVVHPLVLLSIVDHYNRVARDTRKRVVGVLLGTSSRGIIDVTNSYTGKQTTEPRIFPARVCAVQVPGLFSGEPCLWRGLGFAKPTLAIAAARSAGAKPLRD